MPGHGGSHRVFRVLDKKRFYPCGVFQETASDCRRYPWPDGWPCHARLRGMREILLPPSEHLLQHRSGTNAPPPPPTKPRGFIPDWSRGGTASSLLTTDGFKGLSCFFAILSTPSIPKCKVSKLSQNSTSSKFDQAYIQNMSILNIE
jgi:hypothetical protein